MNNDIFLHIVDHRSKAYRTGLFKGMIFVGGLLAPFVLGFYDEKRKNQELNEENGKLKARIIEMEIEKAGPELERIK